MEDDERGGSDGSGVDGNSGGRGFDRVGGLRDDHSGKPTHEASADEVGDECRLADHRSFFGTDTGML